MSTNIIIEAILQQWGICETPAQIYHSAWEINDRYVIKVYDCIDELRRNITMMKTLLAEGIPVPQIIPLPNGQDYYEVDDQYYLLTSKLQGSNVVDLAECDEAWFHKLGSILSTLHSTLQKCEKEINNLWDNSLLTEMNGWVKTRLNNTDQSFVQASDWNDAISNLEAIYDKLPKQLIHRDIHLGNFLFKNGEFSGYIDFDLSQRNIRLFDICYLLLGLLMKVNESKMDPATWYRMIRQVLQGYDSVNTLLLVEKEGIPYIMETIELLFVAYFMNNNPSLAAGAAELFYYIKNNENRIQEEILAWA